MIALAVSSERKRVPEQAKNSYLPNFNKPNRNLIIASNQCKGVDVK